MSDFRHTPNHFTFGISTSNYSKKRKLEVCSKGINAIMTQASKQITREATWKDIQQDILQYVTNVSVYVRCMYCPQII